MYKVEILSDKLENDAIQRRQRLDLERKERIFNPKLRIMGIDMDALQSQIEIKQQIASVEKERNDIMDKQSLRSSEILTALEEKVEVARRKQLVDINEYRKTNQQTRNRRDYDLYDPNLLKKQSPPRTSDNASTVGPSSLQKFEGEDLGFKDRQKLQRKQLQVWSDEHLQQQRLEKQRVLEREDQYNRYQQSVITKMAALESAVEKSKKDQAREDAEYNLQLHQQKKRREEEQRKAADALAINEINSHVNGKFLTESPDQFNISDGHQIRVDVFKGFTAKQKNEIRAGQQKQMEEHLIAQAEEFRKVQQWDANARANQRALELMERDKARKIKHAAIQVRLQNQSLAVEEKKRKEFFNKIVYNNRPQQAYFDQFNTTSR